MKSGNLIWRVALLAYCGVIFLLSSRSDYPELTWYPGGLPDPHYIAHFVLYGGLGLVAWNTFSRESGGVLTRHSVVLAIVFCAMYGLSDETHQLFVPGRTFELIDLAIDAFASAGMVIIVSRPIGIRDNSSTGPGKEKYVEHGPDK